MFKGDAGLVVEAGWGVSCLMTTLLDTLELKVENFFKTLICRFAIQPGSQLQLPRWVSVVSDWGFWGEDGLLPLGCRHARHSPWSALSSTAMVVTTYVGVGMCKRFRS